MFRLSALLGVAALVFAACSSGTESAAPGGESPAAASAPAAGESPSGSAPAGSPAAGGGFAVRGHRRRRQRLCDVDRCREGQLRRDDGAVARVLRREHATTPANATSAPR